ncbi:MAG: hypothetical protein HUJ54_12815, partial [Erysipelotrichaceae bacterium]|nr:hypothetical protein [Erysipelotrichaceae bacterium]
MVWDVCFYQHTFPTQQRVCFGIHSLHLYAQGISSSGTAGDSDCAIRPAIKETDGAAAIFHTDQGPAFLKDCFSSFFVCIQPAEFCEIFPDGRRFPENHTLYGFCKSFETYILNIVNCSHWNIETLTFIFLVYLVLFPILQVTERTSDEVMKAKLLKILISTSFMIPLTGKAVFAESNRPEEDPVETIETGTAAGKENPAVPVELLIEGSKSNKKQMKN